MVGGGVMKVECYLKVKAVKTGYTSDSLRADFFKASGLTVTKNKPHTDADEVAIKIEMDLPNSLFLKPALKFKVDVPEDATPVVEIDANVSSNLAEILTRELGQKVHLEVGHE